MFEDLLRVAIHRATGARRYAKKEICESSGSFSRASLTLAGSASAKLTGESKFHYCPYTTATVARCMVAANSITLSKAAQNVPSGLVASCPTQKRRHWSNC